MKRRNKTFWYIFALLILCSCEKGELNGLYASKDEQVSFTFLMFVKNESMIVKEVSDFGSWWGWEEIKLEKFGENNFRNDSLEIQINSIQDSLNLVLIKRDSIVGEVKNMIGVSRASQGFRKSKMDSILNGKTLTYKFGGELLKTDILNKYEYIDRDEIKRYKRPSNYMTFKFGGELFFVENINFPVLWHVNSFTEDSINCHSIKDGVKLNVELRDREAQKSKLFGTWNLENGTLGIPQIEFTEKLHYLYNDSDTTAVNWSVSSNLNQLAMWSTKGRFNTSILGLKIVSNNDIEITKFEKYGMEKNSWTYKRSK